MEVELNLPSSQSFDTDPQAPWLNSHQGKPTPESNNPEDSDGDLEDVYLLLTNSDEESPQPSPPNDTAPQNPTENAFTSRGCCTFFYREVSMTYRFSVHLALYPLIVLMATLSYFFFSTSLRATGLANAKTNLPDDNLENGLKYITPICTTNAFASALITSLLDHFNLKYQAQRTNSSDSLGRTRLELLIFSFITFLVFSGLVNISKPTQAAESLLFPLVGGTIDAMLIGTPAVIVYGCKERQAPRAIAPSHDDTDSRSDATAASETKLDSI